MTVPPAVVRGVAPPFLVVGRRASWRCRRTCIVAQVCGTAVTIHSCMWYGGMRHNHSGDGGCYRYTLACCYCIAVTVAAREVRHAVVWVAPAWAGLYMLSACACVHVRHMLRAGGGGIWLHNIVHWWWQKRHTVASAHGEGSRRVPLTMAVPSRSPAAPACTMRPREGVT